MPADDDIPQSEKRRVVLQDADVRRQQQGATYFSHTHDDVGGRFRTSEAPPRVIGSTPSASSQYPAAGAHQHDPVPPEPSLGYSIDNPDLESSAVPHSPVEATRAPAGAAASPSVPFADGASEASDAGAPLSSMAAPRVADRVGNSPAADVSAGRPPVRPNPWSK